MTKLEPIERIAPVVLTTYLCSYDCPKCGVGANDKFPKGHVSCLECLGHFEMKPGLTPCRPAILAAKASGQNRTPHTYGQARRAVKKF